MDTATKTAAETRITATELAHSLADVLIRVQEQSERFVIEHNGRPVATLAPVEAKRSMTLGEFLKWYAELPRPDDQFADDLEAIRASQPRIGEPPSWDS